MEQESVGKAIVLAAYGTTRPEALVPLLRLKEKILLVFHGLPVNLAFTSPFILRKWRQRREDKTWIAAHPEVPAEIYGIKSPLAALADLRDQGKNIIAVQSLHVYAGEEYYNLKSMTEALSSIRTVRPEQRPFLKILLGRPALGEPGLGAGEDALRAARALGSTVEISRKSGSTLVCVGHGSRLISSQPYSDFEKAMNRTYPDIKTLVGVLQGKPSLEQVISTLKQDNVKRVTLAPILLVLGEHAKRDIFGDGPGCWKAELIRAGFPVEDVLKGLGDTDGWNDIYLRNLRDAVGNGF